MAFNVNKIEDILITASLACEHIIHAARDVKMVKREILPSTVFDDGEAVSAITEFDVLRREIDLEHLKISRDWLKESGITPAETRKLRKKWNHGWQSLAWFMNLGCPYFTFSQCCQSISDALRLINVEYRETNGLLLDPELLSERILEKPEEMVTLFEAVQFRIRNGTIQDDNDAILQSWFKTDHAEAIDWNLCERIVPAEWGGPPQASTSEKARETV